MKNPVRLHIDEIIRINKTHSRLMSLLLVLCTVLSFVLPVWSMTPAIAQAPANGAVNLGNVSGSDYLHLAVTIGDDTVILNTYPGGTTDTYNEIATNIIAMSVDLRYHRDGITANYFPSTGPHMYVDVSTLFADGTKFDLGSAAAGKITDDEYFAAYKKDTGTYQITDDGFILFTLEQDYIDYVVARGAATGDFTFSGNLNRNVDADGDQSFTIGNQQITVQFADSYPTVQKNASLNKNDGTVTWTIRIQNDGGTNLNGYYFSDQMLGSATNGVTTNPADLAYVDEGGGEYRITSATKTSVTLQYTTKIDEAMLKAAKVENEAAIWNPDLGGPTSENKSYASESETVPLYNPVTVDKSGEADYVSTHIPNEKTTWTITVNSQYGVSLDGFVLEDTYNNAAFDLSSAQVSPQGSLVSKGNGKYELTGINASRVTITYTTDTPKGSTNSNKVQLYYSDGTTPAADKKAPDVYYNKDSDFYHLDKYGSYNADTKKITWTVTAQTQHGVYLNGYELVDAAFPSDISGFNFSQGGNAVSYDSGQHKLTVNQNITYLQFTYETDATGVDFTDPTEQKVTNTITDNHGNTKTPSVSVTPRDTVSKSYTRPNYSDRLDKETYNEITQLLHWNAELTYDAGLAGYKYTDVLSASAGATHTVDTSSIVVKARSERYGTVTTLTNGTDYTVIATADGFEIQFADGLSDAYRYATIEYDTTVKVPSGTDNYGTYTFSNKGMHDTGDAAQPGPTDSDTYTVTKSDPQEQWLQNITAQKYWQADGVNTTNAPVDNVTFKLQYYTSEDSTWRDVKQSNGSYVFANQHDGTANSAYSSAELLELVVSANGSWSQTLNDLPRQIEIAVNGNKDRTVVYYYRIMEIKVGDVAVADGKQYVVLDSGICQVGRSPVSNPYSDTAALAITNNHYAPIALNVSKNWAGDEGSGSHFTQVQFKLQYSLDNGAFQDLYRNGEQFIFNGDTTNATLAEGEITNTNGSWISYDFASLPVRVEIDGTVHTVKYRAIELSVDGMAINDGKIFVDDGYYSVSNSGEAYNSASSNLTLTNTFRKSEDIPITVNKEWRDDNATVRPFSITVELMQSTDRVNWVSIDSQVLNSSNNWTYKWEAGTPNQDYNAESGTVTTYYYKVIETAYTVSAGGEPVTLNANGLFTTDKTQGYYTVTQSNAVFSGVGEKTATITNAFTTLKTTSVTPKKNWASDQDFAENNRPDEVRLQLQQSTVGSSEWVNYGSVIVLTGGNDVSQWVADTIPDLPNIFINVDANGVVTRVNYQYRLIEVDSSGDPITSIATSGGKYTVTNSSEIQTNDWTASAELVVTNTFSEDIGINKLIVDKVGNEVTEIPVEELDKYKAVIDGTEYYVFNWVIGFDSDKTDLFDPVVDELPDGFTLVSYADTGIKKDTDFGVNLYHNNSATYKSLLTVAANVQPFYDQASNDKKALVVWPENNGFYAHPSICYENSFIIGMNIGSSPDIIWQYWHSSNYFYYDEANNHVYFSCPSASAGITYSYSTKIKCDDLKAQIGNKKKYNVTNYAVKYHQDNANMDGVRTNQVASATLTIRNDTPSQLITKTYEETPVNGTVSYTLNINPDRLNLSTGSTIDITDLFKTVSYYDHVNKVTYPGEHLVDVLMSDIKIYQISANGVKTLLTTSDYSLQFDSSKQTKDGAALLNLTVPDEMHLQVEYLYKIVANENTPSVLNGRTSSIKKNGRYLPMAPGLTPPNDDKVVFSNKASLHTESADSWSEVREKTYEFATSGGSIWTEKMPTLVKVDVSDYVLSDLETKFLLAKYHNGAWYYAKTVSQVDGSIVWSTDAFRGSSVDETADEIFVDGDFKLDLTTDVLYKLVEVSVPAGYEGSNLTFPTEDGSGTIVYGQEGYDAALKELIIDYLNSEKQNTVYRQTDYATFLEKFTPVYYFSYNSDITALPSGVSSDEVQKIKQNGELNVTNNQLIDVSVDKWWVQSPSDADATVDVALYWSYTKDTTKMPADAVLADAKTLGIADAAFSAVRTIPTGVTKGVWTDLPNGIAGEVIYYYVKEIAYTVHDVKYSLQIDGTYQSEDNTTLAYYPTYVNNAVSSDGTVTIKNSQTLRLHKVWKDANGNETTKVPYGSIAISIYGVDAVTGEEVPLYENVIIRSEEDWYADLPSIDKNLNDYSSFKVKENGTDLDTYVVSCVYSINRSTGEITVTNRDTTLTEEAVTLNKLWSDGADKHTSDTVTFSLYSSTSNLMHALRDGSMNLSQFLLAAENIKLWPLATIGAEENWSYAWTGLPTKNAGGQRYYYYVFETSSLDGYTPQYLIDDTSIEGNTQYTITNFRSAILVGKEWIDADGNKITDTSLLPEITLDIYNGEPPATNNETPVAPPVVETLTENYIANIPNKDAYKDFVSYVDINAVVRGKICDDGCHPNQAGYDAIAYAYYEAIKKLYPDPNAAGALNIVALGDSITDGYNGQAKPAYPTTLTNLLRDDGYTLANNNEVVEAGTSGNQIPSFVSQGNYDKIVADTDVILLLGGTNDIHQGYSAVCGNAEGVYERLTDLIDTLHADNKAPDAKIIVGSIPYFVFDNGSGSLTQAGSWWPNSGSLSLEELNTVNNGEISLLNYGFKDVLTDSSEPETPTVDKIATVTLNKDNNWSATIDVPNDGSHYYIKEWNVPSGWSVLYVGNGQEAGSATVMIAKNTYHPETTALSVQKTWVGDQAGNTNRDAISFTLMRTLRLDKNGLQTTNINDWYWEEMDVTMPTPTKEGDVWTYIYQDLPKTDMYNNKYYYKVEEKVPTGYSVTYGNADDTQQTGIESGTLYVTNTRNISIAVKKEWANISDTTGYQVILQIIRDIQKDANADGLKLMLTLSAYSVTVDKNATDASIVANKAVTAVSADESIATVTVTDGRILHITGVNAGTTTITVTEADGKDTRTLTVNVVQRPIELPSDEIVVSQGSTDSSIVANKIVQASSDSESVATVTVGADGKTLNITGVSEGTTTIRVTDGDDTKTITVTVIALNFAMDDTAMLVGEKLNLCVKEGTTDVTSSIAFSFDKDGYLHYNESEKSIIALKPGEVTITATVDGKHTTQTITIGLPEFTLSAPATEVTAGGTVELELTPSVTPADTTLTYDYGGFTWTSSSEATATVTASADGLSATVRGKAEGETIITVTYGEDGTEKTCNAVITVIPESWQTAPITTSEWPLTTLISDATKLKTISIRLDQASEKTRIYLKFNGNSWPAVNLHIENGTFDRVEEENSGLSYVDYIISSDKSIVTLSVKNTIDHIEFHTGSKETHFSYKYTENAPSTPRPAVPVIQANSNTTSNTTNSTATTPSNTSGLLSKVGVGLRFSTAQQTLSEIAEASENTDLLTIATTEGVRTVDLNDTSFAGDNCITVTLTDLNNFETIISNLDVYDPDGNKYYYHAEEVAVIYNGATVSGFTPSYSFTDQDSDTTYSINAEQAEEAEVTIRNTKDESIAVELPESGGSGTVPYTATGMILVSIAGIYFLVKRRREDSDA